MAGWTITDSGNILKLKVELTAAGAGEEHKEKWGQVILSGTFTPLGAGDATETWVVFGSETITINREPLPMESTLAKSGSYNAAENEITWTVTITPPDGAPDLSYQDYTVIDTFGDNQTYVEASFTVKNGEGDAESVADSALSFSENDRTINYTFPAQTGGTQTITFKTKPTSFEGADGISRFDNTVNLERNAGEPAADPQTDTVTLDWIDKAGVTTGSAEAPDIVQWTVTVKVPGEAGQSITGARIIDQLHEDLVLDKTHPVQIQLGTGAEVAVPDQANGNNSYYEYDEDEHTLTYFFPDDQPVDDSAAILTFYTRVADDRRDDYLDDNAAINFTNTATLCWEESEDLEKSPSTTFTTSVSGQNPGIGSGGLLSKSALGSGDYCYKEQDMIKWTITVNKNRISMTGATVVDEIPAGQKLLIDADHPFTVMETGGTTALFETTEIENSSNADYNFTYTDQNNYTFTFTGTITKTYTITYYTKIIDWATLYKNGTVGFGNRVTLKRDGVNDVTVDGTRNFNSRILEKSIATAYDYTNHLIQWKIVVNRNRLPLTDATVTDTLPGGMVLLIDDGHEFVVNGTVSHDAGDGGTGFTVTLPEKTEEQYEITFWSKLTDPVLMEKWNGDKSFTNKATLKSEEVASLTNEATAKISNPVITKTGRQGNDLEQGGSKDTIYWSVILNHAQLDLENAEVCDTLDKALQLDPDSVQLDQISIDPLTGEHDTTEPAVPVDDLGSRFTYEENTLTVNLPDGPQAYLLQFSTWILDDTVGDLTNTIVLSGEGPTPVGEFTSGRVTVAEVYSSGGSGSNKLTVTKTGVGGIPLEGAQFRLLNVNREPIQRGGQEIIRTTDSNGEAIFENLPSWVFFVEEIEPAPGYLIPEDPLFYGERLSGNDTVAVENTLALTAVSFEKVGANKHPLSGGTFTLTGRDYQGKDVSIAASAVAGTVTFENVPMHQSGIPYTIAERVAPAGHKTNETSLSVTIAYNEAKTGLVVTVSPSEPLENIPAEIDLSFEKNGRDGPLSGGSFRLNGTDYKGQALEQEVSAVEGVVTFTGIQIGEYTITELAPPDGYLMPADPSILTVVVQYNEDCSGLVATLNSMTEGTPAADSHWNIKALTDISFRKVDSRNDKRLISGGSFQLSGMDYKGEAVLKVATSAAGVVTFKDVPIDDGNGYLIAELAPPRGYRKTTETIEAGVQYNADKTGVVVTLSQETLTNRRSSGGSSGDDQPEDDPKGDPNGDPGDVPDGEPDGPGPAEGDNGKKGTGTLPKTGGAAPSFYIFLAGLALLLAGLLFARRPKKKPHDNS